LSKNSKFGIFVYREPPSVRVRLQSPYRMALRGKPEIDKVGAYGSPVRYHRGAYDSMH